MPQRILVIAAAGAGAQTAPPAATDPAKAPSATRQLAVNNKPWAGDFDAMLERRLIRVYVPYSRSLYFIDKGRERGLAAELVRDFERWVNQKYAKQLGKRPADRLSSSPRRATSCSAISTTGSPISRSAT